MSNLFMMMDFYYYYIYFCIANCSKKLTALDSPRFLLPFVLFVSNPERSIARPETRIQVKRNPKKIRKFPWRNKNSMFVYCQKLPYVLGFSFMGRFLYFIFFFWWCCGELV
jgi:hypothetical protein